MLRQTPIALQETAINAWLPHPRRNRLDGPHCGHPQDTIGSWLEHLRRGVYTAPSFRGKGFGDEHGLTRKRHRTFDDVLERRDVPGPRTPTERRSAPSEYHELWSGRAHRLDQTSRGVTRAQERTTPGTGDNLLILAEEDGLAAMRRLVATAP